MVLINGFSLAYRFLGAYQYSGDIRENAEEMLSLRNHSMLYQF